MNLQNIKIVTVYFILLFLIDYSGQMDLYEQNFMRRVINMHRRRDPLTYKNKLKPFCEPVKMLNKKDINKLQSIKIPTKNDISVISRKNTTTHELKNCSKEEQKIIKKISEKVKKKC